MKISLRSRDVILPVVLKKVFEEVPGYGGGHEHACGSVVKVEDFDRFIELIEKYVSE